MRQFWVEGCHNLETVRGPLFTVLRPLGVGMDGEGHGKTNVEPTAVAQAEDHGVVAWPG